MKRAVTLQVPATLRGIARKQRKVKTFWCTVAAEVEIETTGTIECKEALVLSYQRWAKFGARRKETVRTVSSGHDGRLFRPITGPAGGPAVCADLATRAWRQNPFASKFAPPALLPYEDLIIGLREIHEDRTAWPVDRARRIANDLLLVGDMLWRRDVEPVWMASVASTVETDYVRPFPSSVKPGLPFPILEREAAEEAAKVIAERNDGKHRSTGMTLVSAEPEFLSRKSDGLLREMMVTASYDTRRLLGRQNRGFQSEYEKQQFASFREMLAPGGSLRGAAAIIDSLNAYIDYHALEVDFPKGHWSEAVDLAIELGFDSDLIAGGQTMEFDALDEMLLEQLAT